MHGETCPDVQSQVKALFSIIRIHVSQPEEGTCCHGVNLEVEDAEGDYMKQ